jgi:hypothetical protein
MTGEELADSLQMVGDVRDLFLRKLEGMKVQREASKGAKYPDNKETKKKLEQYQGALKKALRIAKMLPPHLTEIQPDPGASNTDRDRWKQNPPHPMDYLEYALGVFVDWPATIEAVLAGDTGAVIYRNPSELLIKMPKTATHKRGVLLNNLEDLFRIAYPGVEPVVYRESYKDGYGGAFYSFLSDVLPLIDTAPDLLQTLSERFLKRPQ